MKKPETMPNRERGDYLSKFIQVDKSNELYEAIKVADIIEEISRMHSSWEYSYKDLLNTLDEFLLSSEDKKQALFYIYGLIWEDIDKLLKSVEYKIRPTDMELNGSKIKFTPAFFNKIEIPEEIRAKIRILANYIL